MAERDRVGKLTLENSPKVENRGQGIRGSGFRMQESGSGIQGTPPRIPNPDSRLPHPYTEQNPKTRPPSKSCLGAWNGVRRKRFQWREIRSADAGRGVVRVVGDVGGVESIDAPGRRLRHATAVVHARGARIRVKRPLSRSGRPRRSRRRHHLVLCRPPFPGQ